MAAKKQVHLELTASVCFETNLVSGTGQSRHTMGTLRGCCGGYGYKAWSRVLGPQQNKSTIVAHRSLAAFGMLLHHVQQLHRPESAIVSKGGEPWSVFGSPPQTRPTETKNNKSTKGKARAGEGNKNMKCLLTASPTSLGCVMLRKCAPPSRRSSFASLAPVNSLICSSGICLL